MAIKIPWDEAEAAMLIATYIQVESGELSRKEAIRELSLTLRDRAIKAGKEIDTVFRNENGISINLGQIHYLMMTGGKAGMANTSELFRRMVSLYRNDRPAFEKILTEARNMANKDASVQDAFFSWMSHLVSATQLSELYLMYPEIDSYCQKAKVLNKPLFETTDLQTVENAKRKIESIGLIHIKHWNQKSRMRSAILYYYRFLQEYSSKEKPEERTKANSTTTSVAAVEPKSSKASIAPVDARSTASVAAVEPKSSKASITPVDARSTAASVTGEPKSSKASITPVDARSTAAGVAAVEPKSSKASIAPVDAKSTAASIADEPKSSIARIAPVDAKSTAASVAAVEPSKVIDRPSAHPTTRDYVLDRGNASTTTTERLYVDFTKAAAYAYTVPLYLEYFGERYVFLATWSKIYTQTITCLLADYPEKFQRLVGHSITGTGRIDIGTSAQKAAMIAPKNITAELFLETNLSAVDIVRRIRMFLDHCNVDYKNVVIAYRNKGIIQPESPPSARKVTVDQRGIIQPESPPSAINVTIDQSFCEWLSKQGMAVRACNSYLSAIKASERIAINRRLASTRLISTADPMEAKETVKALLSDKVFNETNLKQHYLFSVAIKRYLQYLMGRTETAVPKEPSLDKDPLLAFIKERGIAYSDNRDKGGNLWIIGGFELATFAMECRKKGFNFIYQEGGGRATSGKDAWWMRQTIQTFKKKAGPKQLSIEEFALDAESSRFEELIKDRFPRGFRIESGLEMKRFRGFWMDKYGSELQADDAAVRVQISRMGIRHEDFVYLPQCMLDDKKLQNLIDAIDRWFAEGKTAIYYDALYDVFAEEWEGQHIYNADMLRSYLMHVNHGRYHLEKKYLAVDGSVEVDPLVEIRNCLITQCAPMQVDDLCKTLSHIPAQKVQQLLYFNEEFASSAAGEFIHVNIVDFSDEELYAITALIQKEINANGFISGNEMLDLLKINHPSIMDRYEHISSLGLRKALAYKLKGLFSFNGNIISAAGKELSMAEVFKNFCKKRQHFTLDELNALKDELGTTIYFDSVYDNSLRISQTDFVSTALARFDVEKIDVAIDRFCTGNYIPVQEITSFGSFPYAGYPWNSYLLEHYTWAYSKKYQLMHVGFNAGAAVGAIVKADAGIEHYNTVLADALSRSGIPLTEDAAMAYLQERGYIVRKKMASIAKILAAAKKMRVQKG